MDNLWLYVEQVWSYPGHIWSYMVHIRLCIRYLWLDIVACSTRLRAGGHACTTMIVHACTMIMVQVSCPPRLMFESIQVGAFGGEAPSESRRAWWALGLPSRIHHFCAWQTEILWLQPALIQNAGIHGSLSNSTPSYEYWGPSLEMCLLVSSIWIQFRGSETIRTFSLT